MAFTLDAVTFDGANDYLRRGAALTGASNGRKFSCSMWVKTTQTGVTAFFLDSATPRVEIWQRSTDNFLFVRMLGAGGEVFSFTIDATFNDGKWHHIGFSCDTDHPALSKLANAAIDRTPVTCTSTSDAAAAFDVEFTDGDWTFGAARAPFNSDLIAADLAEVWVSFQDYFDWSSSAVLDKFVTLALTAVNLGTNGSAPTGTVPIVYLHIDDAETPNNFATNRGTGGGFTLTGALTKAATEPIAAADPGLPTTWNPNDKSSRITLSNGNLTARSNITGAPSWRWARSTNFKTTGKYYLECRADSIFSLPNYAALGTAITGSGLETYLGQETNSSAYYANGDVYDNNVVATSLPLYAVGDIIGCAIDLDGGKGWYSKNGVYASGDPVAGTGAHFTFSPNTPIFAGFTLLNTITDQTTANFGATAFSFSPPTGFERWDPLAPSVRSSQSAGQGLAEDHEARVRYWYDRIDALEAQRKAKLDAERERAKQLEAKKATLAKLALKRRKEAADSARAKRRARLAAEIAGIEAEIAASVEAAAALMKQIEELMAQVEATQSDIELKAFNARRRNAALALLLTAI